MAFDLDEADNYTASFRDLFYIGLEQGPDFKGKGYTIKIGFC
jgi:hypothetical protein